MAITTAEVTPLTHHAPSRSPNILDTQRPTAPRTMLKVAATLHRLLYRWSGGRIGGTLRGGPVLLLTTIGRKTSRERTWPLCYIVNGEDLVLVASAMGERRHPGWYLNLRADPRVRIQLGASTRLMVARTAAGAERARLWERVVQHYPVCTQYQRKAGREIPVVVLRASCQTTFERGVTLWPRGPGDDES